MIKLKSILSEVFEEARKKGRSSNTYEYTAEFDGQFIPGLARDTDVIEVGVEIPYNFDPGERATRWSPGEGASVELEEPVIASITIRPETGQETEVDVRFLHPQQKNALYKLVSDEIDRNSRDIESTILDGIGD